MSQIGELTLKVSGLENDKALITREKTSLEFRLSELGSKYQELMGQKNDKENLA